MSNIPELKQKKVERDNRLAKEAAEFEASEKQRNDKLTQEIIAKTKSYEEEYLNVSILLNSYFNISYVSLL